MYPPTSTRPLGIGELLDIAFRLYRRHLTTLLLISASGIVPLTIAQLLLGLVPPLGGLLNSVLTLAVVPLVAGAICAAGARMIDGQETTAGEAYAQARGRWLSLVGATFLQGLILAVPLLLVAACVIALSLQGSFADPLSGIGGDSAPAASLFAGAIGVLIAVVVAIPLAILLATRYAVVIPVAVLERSNATASMRRSWGLTKGQGAHTFGVVFAAGVLIFLIGQLPSFLLIWAASVLVAVNGGGQGLVAVALGGSILSQLGLLVTIPFQYLVMTLLYHDLRVRNEALDLEQRIRGVVS